MQWYFNTNPVRLVKDEGSDPDQFLGSFQPSGPIPGRISLILGDCLQNLRSSLDYLVWELVSAANNAPGKHNMFPLCTTPEAFEDQVRRRHRLDGLHPDAVDEIRGLQPYQYGSDFDHSTLWVLDDLCNINKHRRVLLTNLCCGPSDLQLKRTNGELFGRVTKIRKSEKVGPFPVVDGPRGRGVKIDEDPKIAACVTCNEGAAKDIEISLLMAEMMQYVRLIVLPKFERFFA